MVMRPSTPFVVDKVEEKDLEVYVNVMKIKTKISEILPVLSQIYGNMGSFLNAFERVNPSVEVENPLYNILFSNINN
jgi:hypothetical protein